MNFNPKYLFTDVQSLSNNGIGRIELQQHRNVIQSLAKETNSKLKKNVYDNYTQFIETAKEISCKLVY